MSNRIPSLSLQDNLLFNLGYLIPLGLQGSFTRNPFWVSLLARLHPDPAAVEFVTRLRATYSSDYLYLRMLTTKTLLVLDPDGVRHVLDHSPSHLRRWQAEARWHARLPAACRHDLTRGGLAGSACLQRGRARLRLPGPPER